MDSSIEPWLTRRVAWKLSPWSVAVEPAAIVRVPAPDTEPESAALFSTVSVPPLGIASDPFSCSPWTDIDEAGSVIGLPGLHTQSPGPGT